MLTLLCIKDTHFYVGGSFEKNDYKGKSIFRGLHLLNILQILAIKYNGFRDYKTNFDMTKFILGVTSFFTRLVTIDGLKKKQLYL